MTEIPKTFCPAKWDEIMFNFSFNYVFSCCKSTPIKFENDSYQSVINLQKTNLLNDVQDSSCNYCWKVENNDLPSRRHEYLKSFDHTKFELYKENKIQPSLIELYIGNECNFQCLYCNPKYSSQWEADVKKKPYKIFTDRYFYGIDEKKSSAEKILNLIKTLNRSAELSILGGEPLHNKFFWSILETTPTRILSLSTNLSCQEKEIDRLINVAKKFDNVTISISIDSTGKHAEFTRFGLNFKQFENNLDYLLNHATANMHFNIASLMTSLTIRDLDSMIEFVENKRVFYPNLNWQLFPCVDPRIQSFDTLPDEFKLDAQNSIDKLKMLKNMYGVDSLDSALKSSKFNNTLYSEFKHFINEFANRKNIKIPVCLN
jgi:MoaA/NifB/PqqE/SkfB family radical SAM enzyme